MINLWGKGGFKLTPCASSPGGFCGGRRVAAVQESGRLAPVQKHLRGVVRDRAHLWPHQCRHHGHLHLRHPAGVRKQRRRTAPGGSAPSRKAEIYRLPRADVLVGLGGGGFVMWAGGSWLQMFPPRLLPFIPVGPRHLQ